MIDSEPESVLIKTSMYENLTAEEVYNSLLNKSAKHRCKVHRANDHSSSCTAMQRVVSNYCIPVQPG